jgi:hypothetical protein
MARRIPIAGVLALLAAACGNDAPLSVGDELLPSQPVTSWEVVLDADEYLALDSAFAIYDTPAGAGFLLVAEDFEATLDAHVLARFSILRTITVRDTVTNGSVIDTLPRYYGGRLVVRFDTLRTDIAETAAFAVYQSAETWHAATTTWTERVDSGSVELPWTEPGGTRGDLVATGSWSRADGDSLVLEIDSTTVQALRDSTAEERGLILVAETGGARARIRELLMRVDARSSRQRDTVVTTSAVGQGRTFIYTPVLEPRSDHPRVGGIPTWRTLMRLMPDLGDTQVPCPPPLTCTIALRDTDVTSALLELRLDTPPAGFVLEDSVLINVSPLLELPGVPFARSPLASPGPVANRRIRPAEFDDVDSAAPVLLPVTVAIRTLLDDSTANVGVAITPFVNLSTFGIVPFRPGPRLRLVLTISQEVQLQ